jgi:hypothetical protein
VETQCGWKPPAAIRLYLPFKLENFFYNVLVQSFYQYAGCNLQRATTLSRSPVSPGREQQPPLAFALAKILVRRCWPTEGYNLLFLPGTTFHQFSNWIHEHQTIIKNQPISFSPTRSETSRYFSDSCTQNTVPETTQQKQNPKHSSNKQKQLDHSLMHIRIFNSLQLACIRICVWNNLRIRAFTSLKLRVYAPSLYWTCVQIYKGQHTLPDIQSLINPDYRSDKRHIKQIKIIQRYYHLGLKIMTHE